MPEGPEVKLLTDSIIKGISNKNIIKIDVLNGKYLKKPIKNLIQLNELLPLKVVNVSCRGKMSWIELGDNKFITIHYGMTGTIHFYHDQLRSNVQFIMDDGTIMCYDDVRNFGNIKIYLDRDSFNSELKLIGFDILLPNPFNKSIIVNIRSKYNNKTICDVLMNQAIWSGVGNYIKTEVLYKTRVHPLSLLKNILDSKLRELIEAAHDLASESYSMQGSTFLSYKNNDKSGNFQKLFKIYGKKKDTENNIVFKLDTTDGRKTSYVPIVQSIGFFIKII